MKKVAIIIGALLILGATSCSKSYTCECDDGTATEYGKVDKDDAEVSCELTNAFSTATCTVVED